MWNFSEWNSLNYVWETHYIAAIGGWLAIYFVNSDVIAFCSCHRHRLNRHYIKYFSMTLGKWNTKHKCQRTKVRNAFKCLFWRRQAPEWACNWLISPSMQTKIISFNPFILIGRLNFHNDIIGFVLSNIFVSKTRLQYFVQLIGLVKIACRLAWLWPHAIHFRSFVSTYFRLYDISNECYASIR